jgi:hypothetical protein
VLLTGCTTKVGGTAVKAPVTDAVDMSLMDTGTYPTTLGHIFGTAGDDKFAQGVLEAHRLADFVVGPWQIDETVSQLPLLEVLIARPVSSRRTSDKARPAHLGVHLEFGMYEPRTATAVGTICIASRLQVLQRGGSAGLGIVSDQLT